MANNDIIELLDVLYGMVTEAWGVPLGNDKCIIEREKAIEIINQIKANLPSSIAEAQRLVAARDQIGQFVLQAAPLGDRLVAPFLDLGDAIDGAAAGVGAGR